MADRLLPPYFLRLTLKAAKPSAERLGERSAPTGGCESSIPWKSDSVENKRGRRTEMGVGGALMLVKGVKEAVILRLKVFACQENVVPLYAFRKGQNRLERK